MPVTVSIDAPPTPRRPWYREPWVWFLIAVPGSAVVMGVVMFYLAVASYDGLVADDYYERGLAIGVEMAREDSAAALGLSAVVEIGVGGAVAVDVATASTARPPASVQAFPASIRLRLVHPTRSGRDVGALLRRGDTTPAGASSIRYTGRLEASAAPGARVAPATAVTAGSRPPARAVRWTLHLDTRDWRLTGRADGGGPWRLQPASTRATRASGATGR